MVHQSFFYTQQGHIHLGTITTWDETTTVEDHKPEWGLRSEPNNTVHCSFYLPATSCRVFLHRMGAFAQIRICLERDRRVHSLCACLCGLMSLQPRMQIRSCFRRAFRKCLVCNTHVECCMFASTTVGRWRQLVQHYSCVV